MPDAVATTTEARRWKAPNLLPSALDHLFEAVRAAPNGPAHDCDTGTDAAAVVTCAQGPDNTSCAPLWAHSSAPRRTDDAEQEGILLRSSHRVPREPGASHQARDRPELPAALPAHRRWRRDRLPRRAVPSSRPEEREGMWRLSATLRVGASVAPRPRRGAARVGAVRSPGDERASARHRRGNTSTAWRAGEAGLGRRVPPCRPTPPLSASGEGSSKPRVAGDWCSGNLCSQPSANAPRVITSAMACSLARDPWPLAGRMSPPTPTHSAGAGHDSPCSSAACAPPLRAP